MVGMGIDASTSCIGYSIWDDDNLVTYGRLVPSKECDNWRDRIVDLSSQLNSMINKYQIQQIVAEDVPLIGRQNIVLVLLGAVQGMMLTIASINNIDINFKNVGTWRKDIGISCGEKNREAMKIKSIEKVNELFKLRFEVTRTKSGKFKEDGTDDICDGILVYASVLPKYKVKTKSFGRR